MENRSFEENSTSGNPSEDPKGNPSEDPKGNPSEDPKGNPSEDPKGNPSEDPNDNPAEDPKDILVGLSDENLQDNLSGTRRKQPRSIRSYIPSTGKPIEEKDDESPPAYIQRYMKPKKNMDDMDSLEYPDPTQDPEQNPELLEQAKKRRERRYRQRLVTGPCSLRPDPPDQPPLPEPEPYPDPDPNPYPYSDPIPVLTVPLTTRPFSENIRRMYLSLGTFAFQFPFHTLLLTWPLATAAMGVLNLKGCPLDGKLPIAMMVVGILGTIATISRLYALYYNHRLSNVNMGCYWSIVRTIEAIAWVFFCLQLFYFFIKTPSFSPEDEYFCKLRYYKINLVLMSLSCVIMVGWSVVQSIKLVQCLKRRSEERRNAARRT